MWQYVRVHHTLHRMWGSGSWREGRWSCVIVHAEADSIQNFHNALRQHGARQTTLPLLAVRPGISNDE